MIIMNYLIIKELPKIDKLPDAVKLLLTNKLDDI
jgi:hypothetical protein